jgi:HSP20 family protein
MASIHERFEVEAPAAAVYEALLHPERIVGALPGVTSIYRFEHNRYRADIGSAGRSNEVELEITDRVPGRRIAWRSLDGRLVGSVDLESVAAQRTLVVVDIADSKAAEAGDEAEDVPVIDAALNALKQALESAAGGTAAAGASREEGEDIRVHRSRLRESREERAQRMYEGEERAHNGAASEDEEHAPKGAHGEESWRGGRARLPGSEQAAAVVRTLSREMDRLWSELTRRAAGAGKSAAELVGGWMPAIEVCEQGDEVRVCAEVPGVEPADLHVQIDQGLLIVRGERRGEAPKGAMNRSERVYGSFVRRITLPEGLHTDRARARLRHGVLEICIPVAKLDRGREIPIETVEPERSA